MEIAATKQVNNVQPVQQQTPTMSKDIVTENNSFQNTLNDLNTEVSPQPQQNQKGNEIEVKPNNSNNTTIVSNPNNNSTQNNNLNNSNTIQNNPQLQQNTENIIQNILVENLQIKDSLLNEQNIQQNMQQAFLNNTKDNETIQNNKQNIISENILNPLLIAETEKNQLNKKDILEVNQANQEVSILPQVNKELAILPQVINDKKTNNLNPLEGKIIKEKHELNKDKLFVKDEKNLDDNLEIVSNKNLETQELNKEIIASMLETQTTKSITAEKILNTDNIINDIQDNKTALQSLSELNSKISAINSITTKTVSKNSLGSIKVSAEDATFFSKMVENSTNNALQTNITLNSTNNQINMNDTKAQVLQSSAEVSQALIEKLQESMKTNKSFRVDFDKDIAVIMKVDAKGVLSANFIPGSSAVEQALRNNLSELRQTFNEKGLDYNELSYSSRQQKQQKQQRNQKGEKDE